MSYNYTDKDREKIKAMVVFHREVVKPLIAADERMGRVLDIKTGKETRKQAA